MKRKPDTMVAIVLLFTLGLAISGFSSMTIGSDAELERQQKTKQEVEQKVSFRF